MVLIARAAAPHQVVGLRNLIAALDTDGDGTVTVSDLRRAFSGEAAFVLGGGGGGAASSLWGLI